MLIALTLGFSGSLAHCAGMCSGIVLLLDRALGPQRGRLTWPLVHAGRILAYSAAGFLAGLIGEGLGRAADEIRLLQGAGAIYGGLLGLYFVLVLVGRAPSPEQLFPGLVRGWRMRFQRVTGGGGNALLIGLAWGLLPCGLTLAALFTAAVSASPIEGALRMAVFGLATLPVLVSVKALSGLARFTTWPRYGAALVMTLFSLQIGLRGLAAFGLVGHQVLAGVMLW